MTKESDAYSQLGYYIHQVVNLIDKKGDQLFKKNIGISLQQFSLLRLFEQGDGKLPSQQVIAEHLGINKSAVSRHIEIASKKGWIAVEVSRESRRQNALALTGEGKRLLAASKKLIETSEIQGFGDLPTADIEATLRVLKSLHQKLTEDKAS
ncbi:MAG TPA: MarR family winged helix-turn-helix transcriptional regulator [Candidatus Saccharimonadales bacterium]|nr:MarR family winged helix-turn-helix transcriptional regulator [Candidatus Saccharimonadales bacterium]